MTKKLSNLILLPLLSTDNKIYDQNQVWGILFSETSAEIQIALRKVCTSLRVSLSVHIDRLFLRVSSTLFTKYFGLTI